MDQRHLPMPDTNAWPEFTLPWDDSTPGPTDMSFLLEKPAGASGFVRIVDGHLALGDGRRWRIWGQNITGSGMMAPMEMIPTIVRRLAKFGLNCIRLHFMDRRWPNGLLMRHSSTRTPNATPPPAPEDQESTRALDPEALARLDFFIACCRANGIYIDLNLNVARTYTPADGVKQSAWMGFAKALTYFDPQIRKLQREYASQLLSHVNPYTGHRYAEDPAIALVELVNENSILESWVSGRLRGKQTRPFGTWGDIPPAYASDLDRLWNDWLSHKYADRPALVQAWGGDLRENEDAARGSVRRLQPEDFATASAGRFQDEATFLAEMERDYFQSMAAYLRGELGVKQIILGTSDHNHGINGALHVQNNAVLGIVDGHVYWQHPRYGSGDYSATAWTITNTPMVDAPDHSAVAQLSRSRVLGMPYTVSETNEPFPNDFESEFIPIVTAYAMFQDWDGLFWYDYGGGSAGRWQDAAIARFFPLANDPVKMTETAIGALMFLRGDVQPACDLVEQKLTHERVLEALRKDRPDDVHPYAIHHIPGRLALVHKTGVADFEAAEISPQEGELQLPQQQITSDTCELIWQEQPGEQKVLINTPRHQAIVGHAGQASTENLTVDLQTPFGAVQLASLEEAPISQAGRMLLVTVSRAANTDMRWQDDSRQSLGGEWGHAPVRLEPVTGTLVLKGLQGARGVTLQALDERGQPKGEERQLTAKDSVYWIELQKGQTAPWYVVRVQR